MTSATTLATVYGVEDPTITSHTTKAGQRTLLIPTIAAVDGSDPATASAIINDATLKAQHVATIVNLAVSKSYDGVDLDYEHLPNGDRAAFSSFAADLAAALHAKGKTLSFAVGGETGASGYWDYDALSAVADQLHIMAYDYHFLGSHPGPVSPLGWVQRIIDYSGSIAGGARKNKFILGLPNYGLAGSDSSVTSWYGPLRDSIALAGANYLTTTDHMAVCPFVDVGSVAAGRAPNAQIAQGHLFFDDLLSFEEKISAAQSGGLGGITYWTIGGEPDKPGTASFFQMVRGHFPK